MKRSDERSLKNFRFFYLFFLLFFITCQNPELENLCDPKYSGYYETIIFKILSGNTSNHCGLNLNQVFIPMFSPNPGHYTEPNFISITSFTPGATIYITTDGSLPTTNSTPYTSPSSIWRLAGQKIRAVATKLGMDNSPIAEATYSLIPLKTGQTGSFGTGSDGDIRSGFSTNYSGPSANATYPNDYTTYDQSTGILWKSCSQGLEGPTCGINSITAGNFSTLSSSCTALNSLNSGNGYAGQKTWRLPTMKELLTTNDADKAVGTMINPTAFPATVNYAYWASTPYLVNLSVNWYLDYTRGDSYLQNTNVYHGRCVASPAPIETVSYTDHGDGTVRDNATGLTWQKCSYGQNNDNTCSLAASVMDWGTALTYCNTLNLGSRTWRLPNRNELVSLFHYPQTAAPMIDQSVFPNTSSNFYWTSTTHADATANAWYVNFNTPAPPSNLTEGISKATSQYVRCVSQ
ncbi:DUF1566 domain-containing protein [Leptospira congkakensis]|uniref:DUF1566 domain-containing protein n=1 Tax=Leptospira congkakensis TaxID=2484932 RepID=A0A4Z1AB75_9LEPT|nr:DUF1566 domain-containing protein [Leptospira congkakensis]TGL87154.1 DUF1566 domain-containing protein [Leptospira congkakensis]TGL96722.1 DUF1566 domain-containing protein [Leptospira congkakensis]TGL97571.1 DUF1566 domain-containing protein [Leptospira congkakensis]